MNKLIDEAKGKPIKFLTINNEERSQMEALQKELPSKATIARDVDGSTFEAFWVNGIPEVVVLDKDGKIAIRTHPEKLNMALLDKVLAGKPAGEPDFFKNRIKRSWNFSTDDAQGTWLKKVSAGGGMSRTDPRSGTMQVFGVPLSTMLWIALDMNKEEVDMRIKLEDGGFYSARIEGNGSMAASKQVLLNMLLNALDAEVVYEKRKVEAYALKIGDPSKLKLASPGQESKRGGVRAGQIGLYNKSAEEIAKALRAISAKPMVDQTGLAEKINVEAEWDPREPDQLVPALRENGLAFEKTMADVQFAIVKPRRG